MNLRQLFCDHDYIFVRNIYGDEINICNGYRSIWKCSKCGKTEYRHNIHNDKLVYEAKEIYNKYYEDKYNKWCSNNESTLNYIKNEILTSAKQGYGTVIINLMCNSYTNDKEYYRKWIENNGFNVTVTTLSAYNEFSEKYNDDIIMSKCSFTIKWKENIST